ncbi:hypothetical protein D3C81_2058770 [compost metagenome]
MGVPRHQEFARFLTSCELHIGHTLVVLARRAGGPRDHPSRKQVVVAEDRACAIDQGILARAAGPHHKEEDAGIVHH